MAILNSSNQYIYTGKGSLDSKSLVKTYAELLATNTWTVDGVVTAYNGMLTAVWLNTSDTSKNGVYFLYDPAVTTARKAPDVTNEANWHKLVEIDDLTSKLSAIDERLTTLESEKSDVLTYGYRKDFPSIGELNILYAAADEGKTYIWFNDQYIPVGCGEYEEPTEINGGDSGI
jgi:hypothetical protein